MFDLGSDVGWFYKSLGLGWEFNMQGKKWGLFLVFGYGNELE
jgi:hypothetical protein